MRTLSQWLVALALLIGFSKSAQAFSLLGPFATWQIPSLNYGSDIASLSASGDLGGPMNLGEEYRWGSPVVVYGFDSTFVEYFGQEGVKAVESAMKVLNDLPAVSAMSPGLTEFPLATTRYNYTAQQLRLRDIKSLVMSTMLQNLGLACPERFAWTIRAQLPIDGTDPQQYVYSIIQRNFDPVTFRPSAYVNNTLYTYQILQVSADPDTWDCQELSVDVANPNVSVIAMAGLQAGISDPRVTHQVYGGLFPIFEGFGLYYSGLTRDDVGALRYLYRTSNTNWQTAPVGSYGSAAYSPYTPASFQIVVPNPGNSPFVVVGGPINNGSNAFTGTVTGGFASTGGRGGPDKVSYVRVDVDPLLGEYLSPVIVSYPETVILTNGVAIRQVTARNIVTPDVLFTAADIGTYVDSPEPYVYRIDGTAFLQTPVPTATLAQDGPGIVETGIQIVLNKVGPWIFNSRDTTQSQGIRGFVWGSYDGTTNAPIVYPQGTTLYEVEGKLFP